VSLNKRILIIDYTTHHPELNSALLEIFSDHHIHLISTASFEEKYFGSGDLARPHHYTAKPHKMDDQQWLVSITPLLRQQDIIIFSTGVKSSLLAATLRIDTAAKKVVYVHNVNYFIERERVDYATVCEMKNASAPHRYALLATYIRGKVHQYRKLRRLRKSKADFAGMQPYIDCYCFANNNIAKYFSDITGIANTATLPTHSREFGLSKPNYSGVLNIAILGGVGPERKDYEGVLAALAQAVLRRPVNLYVLGASRNKKYARKLRRMIDAMENPHLTVHYDADRRFIPTPDLLKALSSVHVLLGPIQTRFLFQFHLEYYGRTKASGADADCLVYNRPMLLPSRYRYGEHVKPFAVPYRDYSDLCAIINRINDAESLNDLYAASKEVSLRAINNEIVRKFLQTVQPV
jgi:hypothetical protein